MISIKKKVEKATAERKKEKGKQVINERNIYLFEKEVKATRENTILSNAIETFAKKNALSKLRKDVHQWKDLKGKFMNFRTVLSTKHLNMKENEVFLDRKNHRATLVIKGVYGTSFQALSSNIYKEI